jgi:hypothetical protein
VTGNRRHTIGETFGNGNGGETFAFRAANARFRITSGFALAVAVGGAISR